MSREVKHLKDALRQSMIEEIFAKFDKEQEDNVELNFKYGTEHYISIDAEYVEDKCSDLFVNLQYEDEGLIYDAPTGLWDLGLSELNEVYKIIVGVE